MEYLTRKYLLLFYNIFPDFYGFVLPHSVDDTSSASLDELHLLLLV